MVKKFREFWRTLKLDAKQPQLAILASLFVAGGVINDFFQPLFDRDLLEPSLLFLSVFCFVFGLAYLFSKRRAVSFGTQTQSHAVTFTAKALLYGLIITCVVASFYYIREVAKFNTVALIPGGVGLQGDVIKKLDELLQRKPDAKWYNDIKSAAEKDMAILRRLEADKRCLQSWSDINSLYQAAGVAHANGELSSAAAIYERFSGRASIVVGTLQSRDYLRQSVEASRQQAAARRLEALKKSYDRTLADIIKNERPRAAKFAKTKGLREKLTAADQTIEAAKEQALQGQYQQASNALVDAINMLHHVEQTGGNYRVHFPIREHAEMEHIDLPKQPIYQDLSSPCEG